MPVTYPSPTPPSAVPGPADAIDDPYGPIAEQEQRLAERKAQLLAEAKAAAGLPPPSGQMVGKWYAKPHWSAQLLPVANEVLRTLQERQLAKDQLAYQARERQAEADFYKSRPTGTTKELQGPTLDDAPLVGVTGKPTTAEQLQWLQKGRSIPSLRDTVTKAMNDLLINEPVRADARQARTEESNANRQWRTAEAEAARAAREAQDKRDIAARAHEAEENRKARAFEGSQNRDARAVEGAANRDLRSTIAAAVNARLSQEKPPKPLTVGETMKVKEVFDNAAEAQRFHDTFDKRYAGVGTGIKNTIGAYAPSFMTPEVVQKGSDWWRAYQDRVNRIRHTLMGSALTVQEKQEWDKSDVTPNMDPDRVQALLARRAELEQKAADLFEASLTAPTRQGQLNALRPPTVNTQAEVDRLPKGTRFVGPDGKTYRKD